MDSLLDSFVFGFANSLHCACMCGPLALLIHGSATGGSAVGMASYHVGRTAAYALVGFALGGLGAALGADTLARPASIVAFVLAAGILVLLCFGERGALNVPGLRRVVPALNAQARRFSPGLRALLLGAITPLLPCGLLWSAFAGASLAGSPVAGASVMGGFAVGSLPLLLLAQSQAGRIAQRFGPRTVRIVQRVAMLLAVVALVWRGVASSMGDSCCHG